MFYWKFIISDTSCNDINILYYHVPQPENEYLPYYNILIACKFIHTSYNTVIIPSNIYISSCRVLIIIYSQCETNSLLPNNTIFPSSSPPTYQVIDIYSIQEVIHCYSSDNILTYYNSGLALTWNSREMCLLNFKMASTNLYSAEKNVFAILPSKWSAVIISNTWIYFYKRFGT